MKKVAFNDMKKFGTPPKHFNVVSGRFQGQAETGLSAFWMGMSHYLPGGGVEYSGADTMEEKVYNTSRPATMIIVVNTLQK